MQPGGFDGVNPTASYLKGLEMTIRTPSAEALELIDRLMKYKFSYGFNDNSLRHKDALALDDFAAAHKLDVSAEQAAAIFADRRALLTPDEAVINLLTDAIWSCNDQSAWDSISRADCRTAAKSMLAAMRHYHGVE